MRWKPAGSTWRRKRRMMVLLPAEADVRLVEIDQAAIGDRDAMGVARKIGQYLLGTAERLFSIHDPFGCAHERQRGGKCLRVVETDELSTELESPASNAAARLSRNSRRNRSESRQPGRRNPGLHATQNLPSGEMPPPGTMQCT